MKKFILEILLKYREIILIRWEEEILSIVGNRLSLGLIQKFINNSLTVLDHLIEDGDFKKADQYLIESYSYFSLAKISLLEVSEIYSKCGKIFNKLIEEHISDEYDSEYLENFIDELLNQTFSRYSMLYQSAHTKNESGERERLSVKLESNQQYLENILHSTDQAIMMIDSSEKFIAWNKGAEKIFGYKETEILNKESFYLLPDKREYLEELKMIKSEVSKMGHIEIFDTERKTKEGRYISVHLTVSKLSDVRGNYAGRSVIIKDVSKEKILQRQVDQSEKLAVIGQLAAGIAHEIGNPLASISAIVQILQRKIKEDWNKQQLAEIKANIDRISKIVRELVDFSRPPGHEERLVSLHEIIRTALGIVRYDKRVKKVDFITKFDNNLPKINVVPDQLLQVYVNILLNGVDACNGEGQIDVKTYTDNEYIYTDLIDNGSGMDPITMKKIFDPFFTTKEVGKGTGLGLSVSYGIVKKFKGDIFVESDINLGSIFTVKLPIKKD